MHDPEFLTWRCGRVLELWHYEPSGRDSGSICKNWHGSTTHRIGWTLRHAHHINVEWPFVARVIRWRKDRCAGCEGRFRWKDARFGYMSSGRTWHDACMQLLHVTSDRNDLRQYVLGIADATTKWRVEYWMKDVLEPTKGTP